MSQWVWLQSYYYFLQQSSYLLTVSLYTKRILPISWTRNSLNAFPPMALLFILFQPLKTWVTFCHCHFWHSFYSLHFKPPTLWPSSLSPGNLPNSGIKSVISCIVGRFFTAEPSEKPSLKHLLNQNFSLCWGRNQLLIWNQLLMVCQHHQWLSLIKSTDNLNLHLIWTINYLWLIITFTRLPGHHSLFFISFLPVQSFSVFFAVIFFSWPFSQCFLGLRH